jgi:hypothetical protein
VDVKHECFGLVGVRGFIWEAVVSYRLTAGTLCNYLSSLLYKDTYL